MMFIQIMMLMSVIVFLKMQFLDVLKIVFLMSDFPANDLVVKIG